MSDSNGDFQKRVAPAFAVIDAILKGNALPEPSREEEELLGIADFDPELRYRVAKDVLEQAYGRPRQQVDMDHGDSPLVLMIPEWMPAPELEAPKGEVFTLPETAVVENLD